MKFERAACATVLTILLAGCSTLSPVQPIGLVPAKLLESPPTRVIPSNNLAPEPSDVKSAIENYQRTGSAPELHEGITTRFPYDPDAEPVVLCEPLRVTEVLLSAGESVESAAAGDTERWMIQAINDRVLVKPKASGIATNLIILTSHRTYHLMLKSGGKYMPRVAFYYPTETLAAEATRKRELDRQNRQTSSPPALAQLNFGYSLSGPAVSWKPVQTFDDGERVYIEMPTTLLASDAPALMIGADDNSALVNYQVKGRYYIVDRIFKQAVLVSGTGKNRREITITRIGA
jgi:type IV secretion system protein TrbG